MTPQEKTEKKITNKAKEKYHKRKQEEVTAQAAESDESTE